MTRPSTVAAQHLAPAALADLFTRAYSGYFVPLIFDEAALTDHVRRFDIDLCCSRVVLDPEPAAFALIARRGGASWVGGMGPHRLAGGADWASRRCEQRSRRRPPSAVARAGLRS